MAGRRRTCKVTDCDKPPIKDGLLCATHVGEKRRCEGIVKVVDETTGQIVEERQCRKSARAGMTVCAQHGGSGEKMDLVAHQAQALTAMQRFVQPWQGDLDPVTAFEEEFRRTYGRIHWLEAQISELHEEDLIWQQTKEEHVTAAEFAGTNTTYEAKVHIYEEMLWKERKHFLDLEKVWIGAKLDEKKLQIMRNHIDYTYAKVIEAARALGHDPTQPEVRDRLMLLFMGEQAQGELT